MLISSHDIFNPKSVSFIIFLLFIIDLSCTSDAEPEPLINLSFKSGVLIFLPLISTSPGQVQLEQVAALLPVSPLVPKFVKLLMKAVAVAASVTMNATSHSKLRTNRRWNVISSAKVSAAHLLKASAMYDY